MNQATPRTAEAEDRPSPSSQSAVAGPTTRVYEAQVLDADCSIAVERSWLTRFLHDLSEAAQWMFGLVSLIVFLAVLATIPLLQFLSLGYLLEASGRVARSGRLRDGFIGIKSMARLGSLVAGTWLLLLPVWYLSDVWYSSNLIDSTSGSTQVLRVAQLILTVLAVGHIVASWYCGGRLRHFFWPLVAPFQFFFRSVRYAVSTPTLRPLVDGTLGLISPRLVQDICSLRPLTDWFVPAILLKGLLSGRMYASARDAVWQFVAGLRLPYFFWLGMRGFIGALAWLIIPIMFMIGATTLPPGAAVLSGFVGTLLLAIVVVYLPTMQAHFAAENRFRAMFEVGTVRRCFRQAPLAFWCASAVSLLFALPLYLLKIELTPSELTWIPSLVFVVFIFPARLLTGWAIARGRFQHKPRFVLFRWMSRMATTPVALAYSLVVLASQYTLWYGKWGLFQQHAFLVPVPFLGG